MSATSLLTGGLFGNTTSLLTDGLLAPSPSPPLPPRPSTLIFLKSRPALTLKVPSVMKAHVTIQLQQPKLVRLQQQKDTLIRYLPQPSLVQFVQLPEPILVKLSLQKPYMQKLQIK